jgi:PAS domain S-box-containing protein
MVNDGDRDPGEQLRSHEILQAVFDEMPVMISIYDASGRLVRVNREWERTMGWSLEEARRLDVLREVYPDPQMLREVLEFMRRADRRWRDFRPRTRDGRVIDTSWIRIQLSDGTKIGFGVDVTERKEREGGEMRARAEAEAAIKRLDAIHRITDVALAELNLDDLLGELLRRLRQTLRADAASILLLDEESRTLSIRALDGLAHEQAASIRVGLGIGVSGRIAAQGQPMIVDDYSQVDLDGVAGVPASEIRALARSVMGVPLTIGDKVVGVLTVSSLSPRRFTKEELQLLLLVADRAAPAIERGRLLEVVGAERARLVALSHRFLTAQEEERRRVAVELHDELGQILTAVKLNLDALERSLEGAAPRHLVTARDSIDTALQKVRDMALGLRPSVLDDLGLVAALRWYLDRLAREAGLDARLVADAIPDLTPELRIACFRVAQAALTNVLRHSRARRVRLTLRIVGDGLELVVADDGAGFDVAAAQRRAVAGSSIGILGMEERVLWLGGTFGIRSKPGLGTRVRARFPLDPSVEKGGHRT